MATKRPEPLTPLEAMVIINTLPAFWWTQCMTTYVLLAAPMLLVGDSSPNDENA